MIVTVAFLVVMTWFTFKAGQDRVVLMEIERRKQHSEQLERTRLMFKSVQKR